MAETARRYTPYADYLALEAASDHKHEWCDGQILAMAGGTPEHSFLCAALVGELRTALRGRPCRSFESNLRFRSEVTGLATYADASVVCGPHRPHAEDRDACTNPTVIVEVLSPTAEGYDRGEKFEHYRTFPSLRHYVLVSTGRDHVDHYRRNDDGSWTLWPHRPGDRVILDTVDVTLSVDAIYEGVEDTRTSPADARAPR